MALGDSGDRMKQAVSVPLQSDDLFPHMGGLVPANLGLRKIVPEACRILSEHRKSFLVPIVFLTLSLVSGFVLIILQMRTAFEMLMLSSKGRSGSIWENQPVPLAWVWVQYISNIVLTSCAEAGFHRAVVAAYLKEQHGKDDGSNQHGIRDFVIGALRCAWCLVATFIVTTVLGVVMGIVGVLMGSSWGLNLAIGLGVVIGLVLSFSFTVSFPISALTKSSGFQALKRSCVLTAGNLKCCFGFYLTFFLLSLLFTVPLVVTVMYHQLTVATALLLLVVAVVECIFSVLYAPCRTILYLTLRARLGADDSYDLLLEP